MRARARTGVSLPPYALTVTSRDLGARKARWEIERRDGRVRPDIERWRPTPDTDQTVGLLVAVGTNGEVVATAPCDGVQGIHIANDRLWVAQHHQIAAYDRDFAFEEIVATDAGFNDLHSLRPSGAGLLIASTGTDSIVELDGDGEIVWRWWATENGFSVDSFGEPRSLDTAQDHRKTLVDTWLRTTHVNSAVSFGESTVLATLFHQGQLVAIGKRTGRITVVVDGLARPHAARWSGDTLTLADTARGRALYGRMREGDFEPQGDVSIPTGWLQDCQLVEDQWILVDGENARVYFTDLQGDVIAVDQFDAEWLLYEVAFLSG